MKTKQSNQLEPVAGGIYYCLTGSKSHGTKRGEAWVYSGNGSIKRFTSRSVIELINGDEVLSEPGKFAPALFCPFCGKTMFHNWGKITHSGYECAKAWDRRVKKY